MVAYCIGQRHRRCARRVPQSRLPTRSQFVERDGDNRTDFGPELRRDHHLEPLSAACHPPVTGTRVRVVAAVLFAQRAGDKSSLVGFRQSLHGHGRSVGLVVSHIHVRENRESSKSALTRRFRRGSVLSRDRRSYDDHSRCGWMSMLGFDGQAIKVPGMPPKKSRARRRFFVRHFHVYTPK
jgi:hypothetical protein